MKTPLIIKDQYSLYHKYCQYKQLKKSRFDFTCSFSIKLYFFKYGQATVWTVTIFGGINSFAFGVHNHDKHSSKGSEISGSTLPIFLSLTSHYLIADS
jgi:hypothetical protein